MDEVIENTIEELNEEDNSKIIEAPIIDENASRVIREYEVFNDQERLQAADIGVDMVYKTAVTNNSEKSVGISSVPDLINDDEYFQLMAKLNERQRKYVLHILYCIKMNKLPLYNMVLGNAGVGKSCLIQALTQTLLRYLYKQPNCNPELTHILLSAYTGAASNGIGGITLHRALGLPFNQCPHTLKPLEHSIKNKLYAQLHELKLLIIDEISLVGNKLLYLIDQRLRQIFDKPGIPFGGISIIGFGDFNQLMPVGDGPIYRSLKNNDLHILAGNVLWDLFDSYRLTEIMRQREDRSFAELLTHLANGKMSNEEIQILTNRKNVPLLNDRMLYLSYANKHVDEYNNKIISFVSTQTNEKVITVTAEDSIIDTTLQIEQQDYWLTAIQDLKIDKTNGLPYILKLCIGIKYIVTNNINVEDGLFNGARGTLKQIDTEKSSSNNEIVLRVWIEFENKNTGQETKQQYEYYYRTHNIPSTWTPINFMKISIRVGNSASSFVLRRQLPLREGEAITIHRSQGRTEQQVCVSRPETLSRQALYVACSRVTSLSGLYFDNMKGSFKSSVVHGENNDEIKRHIDALEKYKPIQFELQFLQDYTQYDTFIFICKYTVIT